MTRIARIEYCTAAVPLDTPIAFATAGVATRCFGLLRITTNDGATGVAYCYLGGAPITLVAVAIRELLAPIALGAAIHDPAALWERMYGATLLHGRAGVVMRAIGLIDVALWDCNARRAGLPLYRHLGGAPRETVPAYAAGGYYTEGKDADLLAREMASLVQLGFRAVKMKTGKLTPEIEAARVGAVRAAIGKDVDLLLDANNAWPDLATARRYLAQVERHRPFWIEEPFSPDDIGAHAELARTSAVPVALGENEAGRWRFGEILAQRAARYLQPDATACGGATEWLRIARMAADHGVPVCPHAYHDLHVHLLAAVPNPGMIEFMPGDDIMNFGRLIDHAVVHRNGALQVPQRPGLGFDFVEREVERYAVRAPGVSSAWTRLA